MLAKIAVVGIPELSYRLKFIYGIDLYFVYGILALFIVFLNWIVLSNATPKQMSMIMNSVDYSDSEREDLMKSCMTIGSVVFNDLQNSIKNSLFSIHNDNEKYIQLKDMSNSSIIQ